MSEKWKWRTAGRLRRGAVILGVAGLTAGAAVLTAGSALAGVGAQPGSLELLSGTTVLTGGALNSTPTWATTTACPSGFQASAAITEFTSPGGAAGSLISAIVNPGTGTFSGTLDGTVGALLNTPPVSISATSPGTAEWVVGCYSQTAAGGSVVQEQSLFITVAAGATTYTVSSSGPSLTSTSTTVTASPTSAATGTPETFTANVTAGSAFPAGTVQFTVNGTALGSPVAVNTGNVSVPAVSTPDTFTTAGTEAVQAVFTPTDTTTFAGSTGNLSLLVQQSGSLPASGSPVTLSLTITASGTLSVSVSPSAETLTLNSAGTQATGSLGTVTVTDSRNTFPGWSVSGQESAFTGSGTAAGFSIPGDDLGWAPAASGTLGAGVTIGATVAPGTSPGGLGDTGDTLISATPGNGFGTNAATAALTLNIPAGQAAGSYAGSLTITYLSVGP